MQVLNLDSQLSTDNWALARMIRRDAPWNVLRPKFPVATFYDALRDGTGVDIYHVDSGIDTTHSETAGRVTLVYNYYGGGWPSNGDDHGHGTSTASQAAGLTCGPARGAELRVFKIYSSGGITSDAAINATLAQVLSDYSARSGLNRPAIVHANFGVLTDVSAAITPLLNAGLPVIGSAHNFGANQSRWPGVMTDAIGVGGICAADLPYYLGVTADSTGATQIGTNFGTGVDILAPAQNLRVARRSADGGGYRIHSGNSYSSAVVAGIAACMLQGHDRMVSLADVQAFNAKLLANATTGRLRSGFGLTPLPDRIAYLDPSVAFESF